MRVCISLVLFSSDHLFIAPYKFFFTAFIDILILFTEVNKKMVKQHKSFMINLPWL